MNKNTNGKQWYSDHLKSDHFRALRRQKWRDCRGYCEGCGERIEGAMQCHHTSYSRLGTPDEINDVEALCEICHLNRHRLFGPAFLMQKIRDLLK